MNKRVFTILLILTFVVIVVMPSLSQPPDPPPEQSPIDGGVGFLLAAGLIYGVHRFKKSRKS